VLQSIRDLNERKDPRYNTSAGYTPIGNERLETAENYYPGRKEKEKLLEPKHPIFGFPAVKIFGGVTP